MSDYKQSSVERRDFKSSKEDIENRHSSLKKKDTKDFCRGKKGKLHKLAIQKYADVKQAGKWSEQLYMLYCTACGKELEIYWGSGQEKPEWLIDFLKK